jgi:peptidoglycan/xylan/chitin deacetylase (PgdA/CDA1 family)
MRVTLLNRLFRSALFGLLRFSGLPFLIRELWQRHKVTIVVYHALAPARAAGQFSALRKRYNVISLSDFLAARSGQTTDKLPPKALIITFDDGHRSNYALTSMIQRDRIPVTIFLCSGIVGTQRHYWWSHTNDPREAQALKALPDEQRVQALRRKGHADRREYEARQSLSRNEIAQMRPVVDFQSHTVFHPILPACSIERARWEVVESKKALEREHGLKIYALAYPNGDYSDREIDLLRTAGYTCGLTADAGFNDFATDPFRLRRVTLPDHAGVNEVIVKTSGLWMFLKALGYRNRLGFSKMCHADSERPESREFFTSASTSSMSSQQSDRDPVAEGSSSSLWP